MADFTPVALGIKPPTGDDPFKALGTLANAQLASAHMGLYNLEAVNQANKQRAVSEFQQTGDPTVFGKYGHPELGKQYQDLVQSQDTFKRQRGAADATYVLSLPPGQRSAGVDYVTSQAASGNNRYLSPLEAQHHRDMYAQLGDNYLHAVMAQHPDAAKAWAENAPTIARTAGQEAVKVPYDIQRKTTEQATAKQLETGQATPENAQQAGQYGAAAAGLLPPGSTPAAPQGQSQGMAPLEDHLKLESGSLDKAGRYWSGLEARSNGVIPDGYMATTAGVENIGKNPNSSANGWFQMLDKTAKQYNVRNRNDPMEAGDGIAQLTKDNANTLKSNGIDPDGRKLYLAHVFGGSGASALLSSPNSLAKDIVGTDAVKLNGGDPNTTRAGQLSQYHMNRWSQMHDQLFPQQTAQTHIGLTPSEDEFAKTLGKDTATKFISEGEKYAATNTSLQRLASLNHNIDVLGPGWMGSEGNRKLSAAKSWNTLVDTLGGPKAASFKVNPATIAAGEGLTKDTIRSGFEFLTSSMGLSREAASVVKMSADAVPSILNSYVGAKYITAGIKAGIDYQRAQYEYKANILKLSQGPHPALTKDQAIDKLSTANEDFAKLHPPEKAYRDSVLSIVPQGARDQLRDLASDSAPKKQRDAEMEKFNNTFGPGMAEYSFQQDKENSK